MLDTRINAGSLERTYRPGPVDSIQQTASHPGRLALLRQAHRATPWITPRLPVFGFCSVTSE